MAKHWPTFTNMISGESEQTIRQRHAEYLARFDSLEADCLLLNLESIAPSDPDHKRGYRTRYRLEAHTYEGWKVLKLHSGCFAMIPALEKDWPQ
jgi:hypothetical protein